MTNPRPPLVRRIDHVWIPLDAPGPLLDVLTGTFLTTAWPLMSSGGYESGAVFAGNLSIEGLRFPKGLEAAHCAPDSLRVVGIAFEPAASIENVVEELRKRGVRHTPPSTAKNGGYTNIYLRDFSGISPFICRYRWVAQFEEELGRQPTESEHLEKLRGFRPTLDQWVGGPIGVERVTELVVGARDPEAERARWQALLEPIEPAAPGLWHIGWGPSLRVISHEANEVVALKVGVRSLDVAKQGLDESGLTTTRAADELIVDPDQLFGLRIHFAAVK